MRYTNRRILYFTLPATYPALVTLADDDDDDLSDNDQADSH